MKIIVAPPGSNKRLVASRLDRVVYADDLPAVKSIYTDLRDKYGAEWWRSEEVRAIKDKRMAEARITIEPRVSTYQVLATADTALVERTDTVIVVIPTIDELIRNTINRGPDEFEYPTVQDARVIHDYYRRWAVKHMFHVGHSVVTAVRILLEPVHGALDHVPSLEEIRQRH